VELAWASFRGRLEDEPTDIDRQDGDAQCETDVAGDTVAFAFDFTKLTASCSPAYGDERQG
jgi:hypothetical protein